MYINYKMCVFLFQWDYLGKGSMGLSGIWYCTALSVLHDDRSYTSWETDIMYLMYMMQILTTIPPLSFSPKSKSCQMWNDFQHWCSFQLFILWKKLLGFLLVQKVVAKATCKFGWAHRHFANFLARVNMCKNCFYQDVITFHLRHQTMPCSTF